MYLRNRQNGACSSESATLGIGMVSKLKPESHMTCLTTQMLDRAEDFLKAKRGLTLKMPSVPPSSCDRSAKRDVRSHQVGQT